MRDAAIAIIREIGVDTGGSNIQFGVQSRERRDGGDRDEPARLALLGAGLARPPASRSRRSPPSSRSATRSTRSTNDITRETPASFEPTHRLRGHQDPALHLREVPRRRRHAHHADEVRGRGDGDRPHLQGELPEGAALARDRARRPRASRSCPRARPATARRSGERIDVPRPARPWAIAEALPARRHGRGGPPALGASTPGSCATSRSWSRPRRRCAARGADGARAWLRPAEAGAASPTGGSARPLADRRGRGARAAPRSEGVRPVYKRVDTCAAEFEAHTPYLYSTYEDEGEARADATGRRS